MSGFSSMFSQLLKLFPRTEFQALVKRTYAERHARGFTCWGQCVAFCCEGSATMGFKRTMGSNEYPGRTTVSPGYADAAPRQ